MGTAHHPYMCRSHSLPAHEPSVSPSRMQGKNCTAVACAEACVGDKTCTGFIFSSARCLCQTGNNALLGTGTTMGPLYGGWECGLRLCLNASCSRHSCRGLLHGGCQRFPSPPLFLP